MSSIQRFVDWLIVAVVAGILVFTLIMVLEVAGVLP